MKKSIFLPVFLCIALFGFSQTSKTVDINEGGLSSAITEAERATLTDLTVTGFMNSNDFNFIRNYLPVISTLDLSAVEINNKAIPNSAFYDKESLTKVILPSKATIIDDFAFYDCDGLTEIVLPDSLINIGYHAFAYNEKLTTIGTFPPSLMTIESYAFYNCNALGGNLVFPPKMQNIPYAAFHNCNAITGITLPDSLRTIENYAFYNIPLATGKLVIPAKVTFIGYQAFYNNHFIEGKVECPVPPAFDNSFGDLRIFYVPMASKTAYRENSNWNRYVLIGGDVPVSITINMTTAGTLGDMLLQQTEYLKDVNKLKITGPMNSTDMALLKTNLPDLISLDFSKTDVTDIPNSHFREKTFLTEIILPDSLQTIGEQAFYRCYNLLSINIPEKVKVLNNYTFYECVYLKDVVLPDAMTSINNYVFMYNYALENINLPDSLNYLGYQTFYYCSSLDSIVIPQKVTTLYNDVFSECYKLAYVELPDNITSIGNYTFYNNYALKTIDLPEKLVSVGYACFYRSGLVELVLPPSLSNFNSDVFDNCSALKKITCQQPTPPVLPNDPFDGVDKTICVLEVPFWSATMYKQANIWSFFATINSYTTEMKEIPISGALSLNFNVRPTGFPNVTILNTGSLIVGGNAPFVVDNFMVENRLNGTPAWGSLINDCPAMSANNIKLKFEINGNKWYFLSFPFDVAVANIRTGNGALFVVRTYDGATRALNGGSGNWKNLTNDSILHAGKGYIFNASTTTQLIVPATAATKNNLFIYDTRATVLTDYPAALQANKSWNFTGNPYPSYYDSRYIECTAPITVWNTSNNTYSAISLVDDKYAVKPYEAFFVQKPEDLTQISFVPAGRINTATLPTTGPSGVPAKVKGVAENPRKLINLSIANDQFADKSRVVINELASVSYEMKCDASKFLSDDMQVPQLYSIDPENNRYAINERPLTDGIIRLGYYSGSAGTYLLSADELLPDETWAVVLFDKMMNTETDLQTQSYNFTTNAGTFNDRFELRIRKAPTGNEEAEQTKTFVSTVDGKLMVTTEVGKSVVVYTLNGVKISGQITISENTLIPLPKGVYLVKIGADIYKSVVF
ncbi:MAG: leucine-rich repeat protein [Paludibacter sp.]|nr:leucine-rich repeat protein [Paludibacter sp.]